MPAFLPLLFDSERLPARDRLAICREEFGRTVLRTELEFHGDRPLRFSLRGRLAGDVSICATSGTPLSTSRDRTLAADGNETCAIIMPLLSPGAPVKNGGSPYDSAGFTICSMRRSLMLPSSASAMLR